MCIILYFSDQNKFFIHIPIIDLEDFFMKFICSKANLVHGVSIVQKAVPQKTTMTILECILIDVSERGIYLLANDMELGIETVIDGEIIEKGVIALDARQ